MQNQFSWWPQVNEKFSESYDNNNDWMIDLSWNELKLDWGWLYWSFNFEDKQDLDSDKSQDKTLNNENLELNSDLPFFPLLKNLNESWHITDELFEKSLSNLNSLSYDESKFEILSIAWDISDSEVRSNILKSFDNESEIKEDSFEETDFYNDSQELSINLDKWIWWLELMLAQNYISIPDLEWNKDINKDISSAIEITTNSIIKNNSTDFRKQNWPLIDEIRSESNLNNKYKLLKELYKNDLKHDAIHWWDKAKKEINNKKNSIIKKAEILNQKLIDAKKINIEEEKEKELQKLNLEKQKLIDEGLDVDFFESEVETLSWWDLDKNNEQNDNLKN